MSLRGQGGLVAAAVLTLLPCLPACTPPDGAPGGSVLRYRLNDDPPDVRGLENWQIHDDLLVRAGDEHPVLVMLARPREHAEAGAATLDPAGEANDVRPILGEGGTPVQAVRPRLARELNRQRQWHLCSA